MVRTHLLAALFLTTATACGSAGGADDVAEDEEVVPRVEICGNRIDDDDNGLDDLADPACAVDADLLAVVQSMLDDVRPATTGAMVLGARTADGKVAVVTSGTTKADGGRALEADDRFPIGSISKTMTATVVLQLVGEGKLSLDDKLSRWLPEFPQADRISVRQLLNHTSGIYDYTMSDDWVEWFNTGKLVTAAEMIEVAIDGPPFFEPGDDWEYSNSNYILLGTIIEDVTGRSAAEELRSRIFEPLGMRNTYLLGAETTPWMDVHGYLPQRFGADYDVTLLWNGTSAWTAGAVVSTAPDLIRFNLGLLGGELLDETLVAEMMVNALDVIDGYSGYGLGIILGPDWIGHSGGVPGWLSQWVHYDSGLTTVVLQNRYDDGAAMQWATLGALRLLE